ncbi:MAG: hypothetical protein JSV68_11735, partial [Anaerolineaceae bacterium]
MHRLLIGLLITLVLLGYWNRAHAQENEIILLEAEGPVTPALTGYLERGIRTAEEEQATAV